MSKNTTSAPASVAPPVPTPAAPPAPVQDEATAPAELLDAIVEPATPTELLGALIEALGHDVEEVAGIEVNRRYFRVLGKDRSLRSHRIEWPTKPEDEAEVAE